MKEKPAILLLHGWSGSGAFWAPLAKALGDFADVHAPDLPGHARGPDLADAEIHTIEDAAKWAADWMRERIPSGQKLFVAGYSLGGRIAAFVPEHRPVDGLILFSAGLGITGVAERERRIALEAAWAARLREDPSAFWREWYAQPLFRGIEGKELEVLVQSKKLHNIDGLIAAMETFSPARQEPLLPRLRALKHFLYFAGELDEKYCQIASDIARECPEARIEIVSGADHVVPRRRPEICAAILREWIEGNGKHE